MNGRDCEEVLKRLDAPSELLVLVGEEVEVEAVEEVVLDGMDSAVP